MSSWIPGWRNSAQSRDTNMAPRQDRNIGAGDRTHNTFLYPSPSRRAENSVGILQTENAQLRSRNTILRSRYRNATTSNDRLLENSAQLKETVTYLKATVAHLEETIAHLEEKIAHSETSKENYEIVKQELLVPYVTEQRKQREFPFRHTLHNLSRLIFKDALETMKLRKENDQAQNVTSQQKMEIQLLRNDVQTLQGELLKVRETVPALTDEHLCRLFSSLATAVRTLSRTVRDVLRMNPTNIENIPVGLALLKDVPEHLWQAKNRKRSLIEAAIWSLLLHSVFAYPFQIFGGHGDKFHDAWMHGFGTKEDTLPVPTQESEMWRVKSSVQLVNMTGKDTIAHGHPQGAIVDFATVMIKSRACVEDLVAHCLPEVCSGVQPTYVQKIVDTAFELAMQMSLQRARIAVSFPNVGTLYDEKTMTSLEEDARDVDAARNSVVSLVITPGLTRCGNDNGGGYDEEHEIVSPLVLVDSRISKQAVRHDNALFGTTQGYQHSGKEGKAPTQTHADGDNKSAHAPGELKVETGTTNGSHTDHGGGQVS